MIKKVLSAAIGAGMILATVTPAFAAQYSCGQFTTGPSSINLCNTLLTKLKTLSILNYGSVGHTIGKTVVSGNNTTNNNTSATGMSVTAGAARADVASSAVMNSGLVTVNVSDPAADHVGTNNITGPSSTNNVSVTNTKTVTMNLTNNGTVTHNITATVLSGGNAANFNTIVGGVTTGEASSNVTVDTQLNNSIIQVDM